MKLKVTTPNRMLIINNIPVRTPCDIDIKTKAELEHMKMYLRTECAEFELIEDKKPEDVPELIIKTATKSQEEKTLDEMIEEEPVDEEVLKTVDQEVTIEEEPVIEEIGDLKESGRILDAVLTKK